MVEEEYPTTNGAMQNGSSGAILYYTLHARFLHVCMLSRCLELSRKFIKSALLVGYALAQMGGTQCSSSSWARRKWVDVFFSFLGPPSAVDKEP